MNTTTNKPRIFLIIDKYLTILKIQLVNNFAYPGDLFSRSLMIVVFMWVFAQLWRATYRASGQETIAGLSLQDTLWYLMMAESIVLSKPRLSTEVAKAVKDGSIAYLLNKPYNFLLYQFSIGFGDSLLRLFVNVLAGSITVYLLVGSPPSALSFPLVLIPVLLGWMLDFCINAMIGLTAFVTEEIAAFEWIYSKLILILGGTLIPLDFFPDWLQSITKVLPFAASTYAPARLFVTPSLSRFAAVLTLQITWLATLGLILVLLYRRSVQWLSINGG
jgi:ABC-2 type transport system permease protein